MIALLLLLGCNEYAMLRTVGHLGDGPAGADVLFVVDNSASMTVESVALAEASGDFVAGIAEARAGQGSGLADAVERYVAEAAEPERFADVRLAVTTSDVGAHAGRLLGDGVTEGADLELGFQQALLCEATCFRSRDALPSDPGFTCGDPVDAVGAPVSAESLDCLCGADAWVGHCGGDTEEPLEAVLLALCRAVPEPPEVCFERPEVFAADDVGTNEGLLRDGHVVVPVIVTDEGDDSPREPAYHAVPASYVRAFGDLGLPMRWAAVAPDLDADRLPTCSTVATSWGILRLEYLVEQSGGARASLFDPLCQPADLGEALARVGALAGGFSAAFQLYGPADEPTIRVWVDGEPVLPSPDRRDALGLPTWGDGFTYRAADHTVILHGASVPAPSAEVEIVYRPL